MDTEESPPHCPHIQLEKALVNEPSDECSARAARKPEEIPKQLEGGFEHFCEKEGPLCLRKRK
ncbi:MAG: hypothetical protein JSV87_02595 [Candidatus Bathyarchaeota archaeon]|nr:MAG: hypothetical protein JSV87_02595 [Candidatus Bathyarchaeota archaeon]